MTITKVQALGIALALALVGAAAAARGDDLGRRQAATPTQTTVDLVHQAQAQAKPVDRDHL
jgi:hypothetical protein